jgi:hypothetical protein
MIFHCQAPIFDHRDDSTVLSFNKQALAHILSNEKSKRAYGIGTDASLG